MRLMEQEPKAAGAVTYRLVRRRAVAVVCRSVCSPRPSAPLRGLEAIRLRRIGASRRPIYAATDKPIGTAVPRPPPGRGARAALIAEGLRRSGANLCPERRGLERVGAVDLAAASRRESTPSDCHRNRRVKKSAIRTPGSFMCQASGDRAEDFPSSLTKEPRVIVMGQLRQRRFEAR